MAATTVPPAAPALSPGAGRVPRWVWVVAAITVGAVLFAWSYAANDVRTVAVAARAVRESTPLVLGALCGLIGERSGVINIGIEGQMLLSAFAGFMAASYADSLGVGVVAGVGTGMVLGGFLALCAVTLRIDQIIAGTVINILALGLTNFLYQQGRAVSGSIRPIALPGLADLPVVGTVLFTNPPTTYLTAVLIVGVTVLLFRTPWGLRTRAVGEHPSAADTVGVNVAWVRYRNVILAGGFSGLAGAHLSLVLGAFERGMTNGRGFLALAIMIFGRWHPLGAWLGALMFGFFIALQAQLQIDQTIDIPTQFINMVPYLLTVAVLAGLGSRARPPAAAGRPYEKE